MPVVKTGYFWDIVYRLYFYGANLNIFRFLHQTAKIHPDRPAISKGRKRYLSYGELVVRCQKYAGNLRGRLNLSPGDHVAIILSNCPEYLEIMYSCWLAGLAVIPINCKLHPREMAYIIENSHAKFCFTSGEVVNKLEGMVDKKVLFMEVGSGEFKKLSVSDLTTEIYPNNGDDPAWLFYTSGTTGKPKGVVLTHRNLEALSMSYFASVDVISPKDAILQAAPMSHASGFYNFPHIYAGANNIIPESGGFDSEEIFELCGFWNGVSMFAAPTMVKRMVTLAGKNKPHMPGIKTIILGGGPVYVNDLMEAKRVLGPNLAQIYAQGESPMMITSLSKWHINDEKNSRYLERIGSVGVPQIGVEVKVVDDQDQALPIGHPGEIVVRSGAVMRSYWRNEMATKEALRNGWLHTGDIGSLDEDGFLTLHDRSKDLIISGGSNIYPREVEEVLLRHPDVLEVAVVGKKSPDWGEEVCAFVVRKSLSTKLFEELDELCLNNIARFKRPKHYKLIDELPKNNYGKVLKTRLREVL